MRYLKPSEATTKLAQRMFGGLPRREDVDKIKKQLPRLRVTSRAWQEMAARRLRDATLSGDLPLYVVKKSKAAASDKKPPSALPSELCRRLITVRGGIPDHAHRVQHSLLRDGAVTPELFAELEKGDLVFRRDEFEGWCRSEHDRGLWPSQRMSERPKRGRQTKKSNALRSRVMAAVEDGTWTAAQPVMSLHRLLEKQGFKAVPSHDSLARLVDDLHLEMGNPNLRRKIRRRGRSKKEILRG